MAFSRDDVLAIARIDDAFDLQTSDIQPREIDLIRTALAEDLILMTLHAAYAADDESILQDEVWSVVGSGEPVSKDLDPYGSRQIGINFEGPTRDGRRISVKVGWDDGYFVATLYSMSNSA